MKKIFNILLIFLLISCSPIRKIVTPDFSITSTYYDTNKIDRSYFFYDSQTGILKNRRPEEVIIKLADNDKQEIYKFYKKLNIKDNFCWYSFEDKTSAKISFQLKSLTSKKAKCDSTNKQEINKYIDLFYKIRNLLKSKKEYKEAFPAEFYES
ncbi:hypothetical protein EGY07_19005 [Chryseobacterium indologenes]|uniref:hypothetical protein n=1 Tax=Chryseobacterium indologenes TaxID=253 RepID=UPI000F50C85A|nr:hypothetical protein [Chryseobacterium indologenes]AYZ37476.1 hypothetical protein EGY07_19005 [Chryseobacterium indologenes]MBF6646348.1 hypothetical protein [Chryseobacterium indologenes]MEB4761706.1 hypothetical protein [Chryseobacterium indologenes]QQQ69980.1 hypothetical protein JHW31_15895 [Chryseobacterium indologenes]